jgi:transcription elongation GreA/GreB family factor
LLPDHDEKRLTALISGRKHTTLRDRSNLLELEYELSRAAVVDPKDVPSNVVTMSSKARLQDIRTAGST